MSATPATTVFPLRTVRRLLDRVERALRPSEADEPAVDPTAVDDLDTRELLVPSASGEPRAARASRQAQDYLERRRRKLSRQLDDC